MMINIPGYEIKEEIFREGPQVTWRGIRISDNKSVIIKTILSDLPEVFLIRAIEHEYNLLKDLKIEGVTQVYELINYDNNIALISEDIFGINLKKYINGKPLDLDIFFTIALQLTKILGRIHNHHLIHKDLNPLNIIIVPGTKEIRIIDFSLASTLSSELFDERKLTNLEGNVAYISPEQTGRMNRAIDYRSDYYSLGAVFYEMLTGKVPFETQDINELVYSHIAKKPPLINAINNNVPIVLSKIIEKLMAKMPEDRYLSSRGLLKDLEECQHQWQTNHSIKDFALGQFDLHETLHVSQKLYGREKEIQLLLNIFDQTCQGKKEIFLVGGPPGIGKTSLIKEVLKIIDKKHGFYISGKYDVLQRDVPYSGIIQAFRQLMKQLLALPTEQLNKMKFALSHALGDSAQILINVIPELELIIGKQPEASHLTLTEAQNRFSLLFENFVSVLAAQDHPLVIFLDDLQWADLASLNLITTLMKGLAFGNLLIIGSYRENEVSAGHPLSIMISELNNNSEIHFHQTSLQPLSFIDVQQLLADTFGTTIAKVKDLCELILKKTSGNAFFINEFLKTIYQDKLLIYDSENAEWSWDIEKIESANITNNVVDLLVTNIKKLDENSQHILKLAACIGNTFTLETLETVSETPSEKINGELWKLIEAGLIVPLGRFYKHTSASDTSNKKVSLRFPHDRIQQAAYSLIPEEGKKKLHLKMGYLLLEKHPLTEDDHYVFELLKHFNLALELIKPGKERVQIAEYNLWAANIAQNSAAFNYSSEYFLTCIELLGDKAWVDFYELSFQAILGLIEAKIASGELVYAEKLFEDALQNTNNNFDKAKIYNLKSRFYGILCLYEKNFEAGIAGLKLLGITIKTKPTKFDVILALLKLKFKIGRKNVLSLVQKLKPMVKTQMMLAAEILNNLTATSFLTNRNLYALVSMKGITITLDNGYFEYSSRNFTAVALLMLTGLQNFKSTLAFTAAAEQLELKSANKFVLGRNHFIMGLMIDQFRNPLPNSLSYLQRAYQECLDVGDLTYMAYSRISAITLMYVIGKPLNEVEKFTIECLEIINRTGAVHSYQNARIAYYVISGLLDKKDWSDENVVRDIELAEKTFSVGIEFYQVSCAVMLVDYYYLTEQYEKAFLTLKKFNIGKFSPKMTFFEIEGYTYFCLTLCEKLKDRNTEQHAYYLNLLHYYHKQIKKWAKQNPINFLDRYYLISAEIKKLQGHYDKALQLYNLAVNHAEVNNHLSVLAVICENAGKLYLQLGSHHVAKSFITDAHYTYRRWGALRKVKLIEANYPQWFSELYKGSMVSLKSSSFTSTSMQLPSVDLSAILKANQAISSERDLNELLEQLMRTIAETAGAQRGALIVWKANHWQILVTLLSEHGDTEQRKLYLEEYKDIPKKVINYVERSHEIVLLNNAIENNPFMYDDYIVENQPKSIVCLPISLHDELIAILYLENNAATYAFSEQHVEILRLLASQIAISLENALFYDTGKRFIPYEFLSQLNLARLFDAELGDQTQKNFSILFCDIRGFSKISEELSPRETFKFINEFISTLEPIITQHSGFIDKFIGDAIMALFPGDADTAVAAGIAIQIRMREFNEKRIANNKNPIFLGIGINSGTLILGVIGSSIRWETSVIGDAVNIAAHTERLTRTYNTPLLITGATKSQLVDPNIFSTRLIDEVYIKTKQIPFEIWEVLNGYNGDVLDKKQQTLHAFNEGYNYFKKHDMQNALDMFNECLAINPHDTVVKMYAEQAKKLLRRSKS